jgi:hypothetical protein
MERNMSDDQWPGQKAENWPGQRVSAPQEKSATQSLDWTAVPGEAIENIVPSAKRFGANVAQPFLHPIETAKNIGKLGLGIGEKLGISPTTSYSPYAEAAWKGLTERYGGTEQLKKTIVEDPVGFVADISTLFMPFEAMATLPGKVGEVSQMAAKLGRNINPLTLATKPAGVVAEIGGKITGSGAENIRQAYRAGVEGGPVGEAFRENLRDPGSVAEEIVPRAKVAVAAAKAERSADYKAGMAQVGQNMNVLDFTKIDAAMQQAGAVKTFKGQDIAKLAGQKEPLPADVVRGKIGTAINSWKQLSPADYHTAIGFDALKQVIGDIRDSLPYGSPERKVAEGAYGSVRQTIVDGDPGYAKVMKKYEDASKKLQEFEKTLSLRATATEDTALRKLLSSGRGGVNTNFGRRAELTQQLGQREPTLPAALAGQSLSAYLPHGLMGIGLGAGGLYGLGAEGLAALKALPIAAASSPRLWGELAHGAGRLTPQQLNQLITVGGRINPEFLRAIALLTRGVGTAGGGNAAQ